MLSSKEKMLQTKKLCFCKEHNIPSLPDEGYSTLLLCRLLTRGERVSF